MRILLVEDEEKLAENVKAGLIEQGFAVDVASDGEEGLFLATSESYDCIVLDIMLPKMDGLTVCKKLRNEKIMTPILMLTAKSSVEDIAEGLNIGADDYLTKPFSFVELTARIQALLRRKYQIVENTLKVNDLILNPIKHNVTRGGNTCKLTPKEFAILEYLLRNQGIVVTRTMIAEHVWDYNFEQGSNVIDVFVASMRRKIGDKAGKIIQTVHGVGFKI